MFRWLQICNIDITKFLSTCNLLMWNPGVCRLWFNWISCKSNCLRSFLFWDASILVKLVSLKISLICFCWRFWFNLSMYTLSLSHWTFWLVLPNPLKSNLKILPNTDCFDLYSCCTSALESSSEIKSNNLRNWDCKLVIYVEINLTSSMYSARILWEDWVLLFSS